MIVHIVLPSTVQYNQNRLCQTMLGLTWLVLATLWWPSVTAFCPYQCRCDDFRLTAECPSTSDLEVIPITLNPMIRTLRLSNNKIRSVDASLQFYGQLELIDFSRNLISSLPAKCFSSQKRLTSLVLDENKIANVTRDSFIGLKSLTRLSLTDNLITNLTKDLFTHLNQLELLDLSNNKIGFVHKQSLAGLARLKSLNLSGNRLAHLPGKVFEDLSTLIHLNLATNANLTRIHSDSLFRPLHSLQTLNLSQCALNEIHVQTLEVPASSIRILDVSANRLSHCLKDHSFPQLTQLLIGQNVIQVLKKGSFVGMPNLRHLDFSHSTRLLKIEGQAFEGNPELQSVLLDGCIHLGTLEADAFSRGQNSVTGQASSGIHLSLKSMNWNRVPLFLRRLDMANLASIDLSDNSLNCDCNLIWLHNIVTNSSADSVNLTGKATCAFPDHLAGANLIHLKASQLVCASVRDDAAEDIKEVSGKDFNKPESAAAIPSNDVLTVSTVSQGISRNSNTSSLPGSDGLFRIILVTVCVVTAMLTGLSVLFVVHRKHSRMNCNFLGLSARSTGGRRSSASTLESPMESCACCGTLKTKGKAVRLPNPSSTTTSDRFFTLDNPLQQHHHHYQHQQYSQHFQQPLSLDNFYRQPHHFSDYSFARPTPNPDPLLHPELADEPGRRPKSLLDKSDDLYDDIFDLQNTQSNSMRLGSSSSDEYFLSISTRDNNVVRSIPVSEL